ncbi:TlpA disulfide reductase family protein [Luteimonas pelagia]
MRGTTKVLLVALGAGLLGVAAGIVFQRPGAGPLFSTELGQRALQGVLSATAPPVPDGVNVAERGDIVSEFSLPNLEGQPVTVPTAWTGRPVLVNVWASWCGPCIEEMPELQRFAGEQGANGVQVVGIALDEAGAVEDFLARVPVDYPILLDAPGPADAGVRLGNPKGVLPYSVLLGADGRLLKQRVGPFAHGEIDGWATND